MQCRCSVLLESSLKILLRRFSFAHASVWCIQMYYSFHKLSTHSTLCCTVVVLSRDLIYRDADKEAGEKFCS